MRDNFNNKWTPYILLHCFGYYFRRNSIKEAETSIIRAIELQKKILMTDDEI
jgi:hypothetical protein